MTAVNYETCGLDGIASGGSVGSRTGAEQFGRRMAVESPGQQARDRGIHGVCVFDGHLVFGTGDCDEFGVRQRCSESRGMRDRR